MARFEDAMLYVGNGGRARRKKWACVTDYTRTTPPIQVERCWRIWLFESGGGVVQGWGGQIGAMLADDEPVRDGVYYSASDEDRTAEDWELIP